MFGITAVEVLHRTYLYLLLRARHLFASGIFFFNGSTAPWGPTPPHLSRLHDHILDTPHSVGLLWTSDQPDAETST